MSIGREGGRLPRQVLVLLVTVAAATALWSGCGPAALIPGGIDPAPRLFVLGVARSQHYDTSHGVGDYRRLMVGSCPACGYGPHIMLNPERDAINADSAALAQGRFLARLINFDADSYPKFNLAPHDTVYWWVDRQGGAWRSVYVSSHLSLAPKTDSLYYRRHQTASRWDRSLARFVWQDTDEALWVACDMYGCCKSSGADIF